MRMSGSVGENVPFRGIGVTPLFSTIFCAKTGM